MRDSKKLVGHLYAMFTILVWGSCFVLTKNLLAVGITAVQIIPLRMILAYVTLLVMRPRFMRLPLRDELMFILIGITGGSVYFFLQNSALSHTYAANVSILIALSPILTVILAQLFSRKGERLGKWVYIGAVIAIAGVVMVVLNGTLTFHLSPVGDLLALGAALLWAIYSILIKPYTEQYDSFLIHHGHSAHAHDGRHAEPHAAVYAAEGTAVVDISRRVRKRHLLCHLEHRLPAARRRDYEQLSLCLAVRDADRRLAPARRAGVAHEHHRRRADYGRRHLRAEENREISSC